MAGKTDLPRLALLDSPDWGDYELLDSGNGEKLERYGPYTLVRPEHQAIWRPALPSKDWQAAAAVFNPTGGESGGEWQFKQAVPQSWEMGYKKLRFKIQAGASRHLGVFPEQAAHWDWIAKQVENQCGANIIGQKIRLLCLFGYTGLASLAAARAGAHVTHVDASKKALSWARHNQALSGLTERPIRWLVDDALKFVKREVRRGSKYEGIILDPPKFGRGPKGQVWEFFNSLPDLLAECQKLLSPTPVFIVLTAYAIRASALSTHFTLQEMVTGLGGTITSGELVLVERSAGRVLSMAIFSRWSARDV